MVVLVKRRFIRTTSPVVVIDQAFDSTRVSLMDHRHSTTTKIQRELTDSSDSLVYYRTTGEPSSIQVPFLARDFFRSSYLWSTRHILFDLIKKSPHIEQEKEFYSVIGDDFFVGPLNPDVDQYYCSQIVKNYGKIVSK